MSSSPGKPLMPVTVVDISLSEKEDAMKQSTRMVFIMPAVTLLIGWGISLLIYHFTGAKASYDAKIETLASNDLHWLYFSALVLSRLNMVINFLPMVYKSAVVTQRHLKPACVPSALIALAPVSVQQVRGNSGNLRANMYVYRVSSPDHADTSTESAGALGPVVLEEGGDVGKYNRANRSLHHYIENLPPFLLGMPLCAYVFPAATFVLTCLFAVGRVAHQLGYTRGYGGHGAGFGIALLCTCVQDGLLLTAALSAAGASI